MDTSSRKYQLTLNNPADKGLSHEELKRILAGFKSVVYYCMADEIGLESKTPHTHVFLAAKSPIRFSSIKKRFPDAHIETAKGTAAENRDYIRKEGKWSEDAKADTSVPDTFEEWGELPQEVGQGFRSDIADIVAKISDGYSNAQLLAENPDSAKHIGKFDKIRNDILEERFKNIYRELEVTYIFGPTGTGKTRGVMEEFGYTNVYRITDYGHPFDRYFAEDVILFDEFRSSLMLGDMLNYLDGYPINLPARYANRVACYTKVFIISNIDLKAQYPSVQSYENASWKAFLRRIHHVIEYRNDSPPIDHGNGMDYIYPPVPDWVEEAEKALEIETLKF